MSFTWRHASSASTPIWDTTSWSLMFCFVAGVLIYCHRVSYRAFCARNKLKCLVWMQIIYQKVLPCRCYFHSAVPLVIWFENLWSRCSRIRATSFVFHPSLTIPSRLPVPYLNLIRLLLLNESWWPLTDIVVKSDQRSGELYNHSQQSKSYNHCSRYQPLSPFMMTHILDPTHLSISSAHC